MSEEYFIFQGQEFKYFDHPHNNTRINERTVEIPVSLKFLESNLENLIEVGCVTPYYSECLHEVIDLTDDHPKSKKIDATQYDFKNKNVLSISTVEHVGLSDYGNQVKENNAAINLCEKIIKDSLNYFITWPLGYNKVLDSWAFDKKDTFLISRRDDNKYLWTEKKQNELTEDNKVYGSFHCANSIIILTNSL